MARPVAIGWFNYVTRVGATFSLGVWEPFLPLSNVVDIDWRYVAQSIDYLAASTKFSFAFAQEYPIGMIHVGGIQTVGVGIEWATVQVRAYNTAAVLQYDSGSVQVWNGTQVEWDALARSKFFVFPSEKNIRTVNIDFTIPASASNKIQVGCVGAYNVFVNQVDFSGVGVNLADWACELAPSCTGEIAILSATATATNQNEWIDLMKKTLTTDAKFKGLKLVETVYGDDKADVSTTRANELLTKYPNLKVIVAPTTVGILAAAQVVQKAGKSATVKVTGLGFPHDMKPFVKDGTSPVYGLWNVPDLGYLSMVIATRLVSGELKGTEGETFTVKGLNGDKPYTIGKDNVVTLGPAFRFDGTNVDTIFF
jgi:hypothetical protein